MADEIVWTTIFWPNGSICPVQDFLTSLDTITQSRFIWSIEQLRKRNIGAREPLAYHLEGKLWEIREETGAEIYRLIYFFFSGKRIVFVHGFQRNAPKTPRSEIQVASERLKSFLSSQGFRD